MFNRNRAESHESFEQRLKRLRWQIDSLPEAQRPHLYALADVIENQHRRLHHLEPPVHDTD